MRILTPLIAFALGFLCGCAHTSAPVADHYYRTVSFLLVALSEGERIDWSVEVVSPVSEVSTLKATAGHGSTSLWSSRDLDGFITIWVCEPSCFSIKGTATTFTAADKERTISFTQSDFVMRSSPPTPGSGFSSASRFTPTGPAWLVR